MEMNVKTDKKINRKIEDALNDFGQEALSIPEIFSAALSNGGDLAELFFENVVSTRILIEEGKIDRITDGTDQGVGMRLIFDRRTFYGYTTELTQSSLLNLAQSLAAAVDEKTSEAAQQREPDWSKLDWQNSVQREKEIRDYSVSRSPRKLGLEQKISLIQETEAAARAELPDARQISAVWMDSERKILVLNSDGLIARDQKTYLQLVAQVVGAKGDRVESAHHSDGGYVGLEFLDENPPAGFGIKAAQRVKILLEAKPAPAGTMPVVLSSEAGGTMIHEAVGHGLEADLACNGLSVYGGKLGQKVASERITVVDDGTLPGKRGSYQFDDEGTPAQKNVLIEKGVLKGYMVDRLSAMKFDLMASGNGRRETFRDKPIVRMTNTYVSPGDDNVDKILSDTPWGIYVKAMGGGSVNTVTGDFVFAVTEGYLIRDGKIDSPIRGATLVGNGPKVLMTLDRVASDLGFATGTCGKDGQGAPVTSAQPTLRIPALTVGGEVSLDDYWTEAERRSLN
jgi:TldD protein